MAFTQGSLTRAKHVLQSRARALACSVYIVSFAFISVTYNIQLCIIVYPYESIIIQLLYILHYESTAVSWQVVDHFTLQLGP